MPGPSITEEARRQILEAVREGVHPSVACVAAGMGQGYYRDLRYRAKRGDANARDLLEQIQAAEGKSEVEAVLATARATKPMNDAPIVCPHCDCEYTADAEQFAALAMRYEGMQKAKSSAAEVALKKLERRHPSRWSQKVIHTVQEEHERLLNVCQRVLAPEVFESLLEEYLAEGSGEGEASVDQGGQAGGDVH